MPLLMCYVFNHALFFKTKFIKIRLTNNEKRK